MGVLTSLLGRDGPAVAADPEVDIPSLIREVAAQANNEEVFQERIAELEIALEDRGWKRLGGMMNDFQFDRGALDDIIHMSRLYAIKNPAIKRPVNLQAIYVWAQGFTVKSHDPVIDEVVQSFLADPSNLKSFCGHDALMDAERRQRVEGNTFWRFFTNSSTGRVQVRRLPVEEMRAVIKNPDDATEVWFYVRSFLKAGKTVNYAYPDWEFARRRDMEKSSSRDRLGTDEASYRAEVFKDYDDDLTIDWDHPVYHKKTGGFADMDMGIPETYAAIDWARAYKEALEDYKKTIKSLAKWAWKMKSGGGNAQLQAAATALGTTFGTTDDMFPETNPAPVAGSVAAMLARNDLEAVDVSKAAVNPDGFRRILLMAAMAMDMPETYFGAADATFATAKSMDRPTELAWRDRQTMWAGIFRDILGIAVEGAAKSSGFPKLKSDGYADNGTMKLTASGAPVKFSVDVKFPPILQVDIKDWMQSLVNFVTMNGQSMQLLNDGPTLLRLALNSLGCEDIEEVVAKFYPDEGEPTNKLVDTFKGPLTPEETNQQAIDKAKTDAAIAKIKTDTAVGTLGNQPTAQGPAGAANQSRSGRGGQDVTARSPAREASEIAEAQARMEFMGGLMALRHEMESGEAPESLAAETFTAVAEAIKALAAQEPTVVNVSPAAVTVMPPDIHVTTPEVTVQPQITVEAPQVTIEQAKRTKRKVDFTLDESGRIVGKQEVEERDDG